LSDLEQGVCDSGWEVRSADYLRRFLESGCGDKADILEAWEGLSRLYQAQQNPVGLSMAFQRRAQLRAPSLAEISNVANTLNGSDQIRGLPVYERMAVLSPVCEMMEKHLQDASATDLSRLGWLYLNCGDVKRAKEVATLGLTRDDENTYCLRLMERLDDQ